MTSIETQLGIADLKKRLGAVGLNNVHHGICKLPKEEHKPEGHMFEQDEHLPVWRGWHAFRRGLATNLHALGVPDEEIQAILRHSNIAVTQSCYIKALTESQISAMHLVGEEFERNTARQESPSPTTKGPIN